MREPSARCRRCFLVLALGELWGLHRTDGPSRTKCVASSQGGPSGLVNEGIPMDAIITERLTITHASCERNEDAWLLSRDVFIGFHRSLDVTQPIVIVTLWGNYVEWIQVAEKFRRQRYATEAIQALEAAVGELFLEPVTDAGVAFVEHMERLADVASV